MQIPAFAAAAASLCRTRRVQACGLRSLRSLRVNKTSWSAKLGVTVLNVGRHSSKDAVFDEAIEEYVRRMRHSLSVDLRWVKPDAVVSAAMASAQSGASVLCLDGRGALPKSSEHFAEIVFNKLERGGSRLTFIIGDADGLPAELVGHALDPSAKPKIELLSLGPLTLTHKMVRVRNTVARCSGTLQQPCCSARGWNFAMLRSYLI